MQIDERTYAYVESVAGQIVELQNKLTSKIEEAGEKLEGYHYEVYNKFINHVTESHQKTLDFIAEEFEYVKDRYLDAAEKFGSDMSKVRIKSVFANLEEDFTQSLKRGKDLPVLKSDTTNPNIEEANSKVYQVFAGYRSLISDNTLSKPEAEDNLDKVAYSFYSTALSKYEELFADYDSELKKLGVDVDERKIEAIENTERLNMRADANDFIDKRDDYIDATDNIAGAISGLIATAALTALGQKEIGDVAKGVVGLGAAISKAINKDDQGEDDRNQIKKSKARTMIQKIGKGFEQYNDAINLVEKTADLVGLDFERRSSADMLFAGIIAWGGKEEYEAWKKSGKLDLCIKGISFAGKTVKTINVIGGVIAAPGLIAAIKAIPPVIKYAESGISLVKKTAEVCGKSHIHKFPGALKKIRDINTIIKAYERDMANYKAKKAIDLLAVRKPKAPPWLKAGKGIGLIAKCIERGEYIVEPIGAISKLC